MNIVLAMPTPATISDIDAIPPTTNVRIENIELIISDICSLVKVVIVFSPYLFSSFFSIFSAT